MLDSPECRSKGLFCFDGVRQATQALDLDRHPAAVGQLGDRGHLCESQRALAEQHATGIKALQMMPKVTAESFGA